jgi:DNA polymerase III subunit epsilon
MLRAIYYDLETTGVQTQKDRVVEIAAYDVVKDKEFVFLVNPGIPIPKEAEAVHGISDQMVENAPYFGEVVREFIEFCEGDCVLVAHNNDRFDWLVLQAECKRHDIELPEFKILDTLKWVRRYRPDLPKHSLQFLRASLGIEANQAHRALDDVKILHEIFTFFIGDLSWETVYSLMLKGKYPEKMPFGKYQGRPLGDVPKEYIIWLKGQGVFDKPENKELKEGLEKSGVLQIR